MHTCVMRTQGFTSAGVMAAWKRLMRMMPATPQTLQSQCPITVTL